MQNDSRKESALSDSTWKVSVGVLIGGIIFIIVVLLFQHHYYSKPKEMDLSQVQIADDAYKYYIDSMSATSTQGDYILIKGWVVHIGIDLEHYNTQLVLYQDSLDDAFVFKLAMKTRADVTTYFDDGYDYDSSGFSAYIKSSLLGDRTYHVALLYNDTKTDDGARIILTDKVFTCKE